MRGECLGAFFMCAKRSFSFCFCHKRATSHEIKTKKISVIFKMAYSGTQFYVCTYIIFLLLRHRKDSTLFNKRITQKPLKFPLILQEDLDFKKVPPRTSWKEEFFRRGAYSYSSGFSAPCILQGRSLSACYELMGRDERSKAAMQINHSSVLHWERRQEISSEHYNHMAIPFNSTQRARAWWGLWSVSDGKMSKKNESLIMTAEHSTNF